MPRLLSRYNLQWLGFVRVPCEFTLGCLSKFIYVKFVITSYCTKYVVESKKANCLPMFPISLLL